MVANTRSTPRDPPAPHNDTDMEGGPTQLSLPPTQPTVVEIPAETLAIQPVAHMEPTH